MEPVEHVEQAARREAYEEN
ncbi:MAG: hypothetical protein ACYC27_22145 [Armatimonadota bacterium]